MPSSVVLSHGPTTISPFPSSWLIVEAKPPVYLSALGWFFADASLPFWTTWHYSGSPQSSPTCFISCECSEQRIAASFSSFPEDTCFLVVFKHRMSIVSLHFTRHPAACSCDPDSAHACYILVPVPSVSREICPTMQFLNWWRRLL